MTKAAASAQPKIPTCCADPFRAALAEAINARRSMVAGLAAHREAIAAARRLVGSAEAAAEQAGCAVAEAKDRRAKQVMRAAAGGGKSGGGNALRAARAAELEAQDELDAARDALAKLEAQLDDWEHAARVADQETIAAAECVLVPAVERLLAETQELEAEVCARREVLALFLVADLREVPGDDFRARDRLEKPFMDLRPALKAFLREQFHYDESLSAARLDEWKRVRHALREDPATPLPGK